MERQKVRKKGNTNIRMKRRRKRMWEGQKDGWERGRERNMSVR